jgi:phospholipase C
LAIYPYAGEFAVPRHLDVPANGATEVTIDAARHRLAVVGPNGFLRTFAGDANGAAAQASILSEIAPQAHELRLTLSNANADTSVTFVLTSDVSRDGTPGAGQTMAVGPGTQLVATWPADNGWYDLTITMQEDGSFSQRLAGHIEDGKPSVSG